MKLTDFYIRQFRDLQEVRLVFTDLTVLIGRNGAGKSSMLTALESLGTRLRHFGGTEDLMVWKGQASGWTNRDLGVYAIYEVDDDLNGQIVTKRTADLEILEEWSPQEEFELRSQDTLNLLAAVLEPQCFRSFLTKTPIQYMSGIEFVLSAEAIEPELDRAISLFHCCDVFEAFQRARTDPALAEHAKGLFSDDLPWIHQSEKKWVESRISGRGQFELEIADAVRQAAAQLVPTIRSSRRFAWTGSGYAGIAVERSEISEETGKYLTQIADIEMETFGNRSPLPLFFGLEPTGSPDAGPLTFNDQFDRRSWSVNSSMFSGFTARCSAPVFDIAKQWKRRSPFLLMRLTPGGTGTTPFRVERDLQFWSVSGVQDPGAAAGLTSEEEFVAGPLWSLDDQPGLIQTISEPPRNEGYGERHAVGPPDLATVGAGTVPDSLETEIEACLPDLHDQLWRTFAFRSIPARSALHGRPQALLESVYRRRTQGHRWLWSTSEGVWEVQPTLHATIKLLENAINEVVPAFVGFAGIVTLSLLDVDHWHEGRFIELLYGGKPLDRLPAGIARWVATSVRIGGRNLFNSKLVLDELTSEEEAEAFLEYVNVPDDFDLATVDDAGLVDWFCLEATAHSEVRQWGRGWEAENAAVWLRSSLSLLTVMNDPDGWRRVSVSPLPHRHTLLLVDEPELHLHVDALTDVRNWFSNHLWETGVSAVVATHSPSFLDYRPSEARIAMVENLGHSHSMVEDITDNVGFWLSEHGEALGTETIDAVLLKRGFLLVEGPHDEIVIKHFYANQLARHRIGIIAMWGFINTLDLTESRYLRYAGRPIAMLLDNVPEYGGDRHRTVEERNLERFRGEFKEASIPFEGVGHGALDIMFTLPEEAVRRHLASLGIEDTFKGGWKAIQQEIRPKATNGPAKKKLAQELLGLEPSDFGLGPGNFIHPVLKACTEDDRPTSTLERAMEKVFGFFQQPNDADM